eukprot:12431433-Karenia_brevis.AAC.2
MLPSLAIIAAWPTPKDHPRNSNWIPLPNYFPGSICGAAEAVLQLFTMISDKINDLQHKGKESPDNRHTGRIVHTRDLCKRQEAFLTETAQALNIDE